VHATWQDNLAGDQSVRAIDIIKVLVQFLQYMVIVGSVSVPWPVQMDLQRWFNVASALVFGPASGQAMSLDCWLNAYIPQGVLPLAIQRQLVYLLAPVGIFLGVLLLQCVCWLVWQKLLRKLWRKHTAVPAPFLLWRKLPIVVLIAAYYAYPTLLRASLGFFACLRIDRGEMPFWRPGDPAPQNHTRVLG
jgi:hypothetical protein